MHKIYTQLKSCLLLFLWLLLTSYEGLSYRHLTTEVPQSIHILEIDPHLVRIISAHAHNQSVGKATVKTIALQYQARAAINGGFFEANGVPAGILKINQKWYALPHKPRGAIGWTEDAQQVVIDQLLCECSIRLQGRVFTIDGFNRARKDNEIVLFSPSFHRTTLTNSNGIELIIRHNQIIGIKEGGNNLIPSDGWVLSIGSKQKNNFWITLPLGIFVHIDILPISQTSYTSNSDWLHLPYIVGGTPVLIRHGEIIADFSSEETKMTFLTQRHARTAIGLLPNGNWLLVVVDGNQPSISQGMTMNELACLMSQLGCKEALNLDGGGSSTMVIDQAVVNDPFGDQDEDQGLKKVRKVADAILILDKQ